MEVVNPPTAPRGAVRRTAPPLPGARGPQITGRDERCFEDLYFTDWMDTDQLYRLHFEGTASRKRAYNRLTDLVNGEVLTRLVLRREVDGTSSGTTRYARRTFFSLSQRKRNDLAHYLARRGLPRDDLFAVGFDGARTNPELAGLRDLSQRFSDHHGRVVDLYCALKPTLVAHLGEPSPDTWFWRNERRAFRTYRIGTDPHYFNPDAELVVPVPREAEDVPRDSAHLFIEVQTAHSRATSDEIAKKVSDHARAAGGRAFPKRRALLFVTETEAHKQAAVSACRRLGVQNHAAGPLDYIAALCAQYARLPHALDPAD